VAYEKGRAAATAEEAKAAYEESIRLDPTRPEPWNALGLLALVQGDRALARRHLVRSLELDPAYGPALHNLHRLN
jgi:Flp pilus assembly protein TadD